MFVFQAVSNPFRALTVTSASHLYPRHPFRPTLATIDQSLRPAYTPTLFSYAEYTAAAPCAPLIICVQQAGDVLLSFGRSDRCSLTYGQLVPCVKAR